MKIPQSLRRITSRVRDFHDDEAGDSNAMTNVMMLALAALVIVALFYFGETVLKQVKSWYNTLVGTPPKQYGN